MLNRRSALIVALTSASVGRLAAQGTYYCYSVPRAPFGIEAYQCANCGIKLDPSGSTSYTFFAEPVVTQVASTSRIAVGDVIVAVDASPITTQDGADRFVHPGPGSHVLTMRRGRDRWDLRFDLPAACDGTRGRAGEGNGGNAIAGGVGAGGGRSVAGGARAGGGNGGGGFSAGSSRGQGGSAASGGQVRIDAD